MANVLSTTQRAPAEWAASAAARDVDDVEQRVRRRLDPDHPRARVEQLREALVEGVHRRELEVVALRLVDLREDPVGAAVDVVDRHDPVARRQQVEHRRDRSHAGGEREPVGGVLERGEALLERGARGVRRARVVEALVDADLLLHVRRGLVDRDDDRARRRVGLLTHVDGTRLEVHPSATLLRSSRGGRPGTRAGRPA